MDAESILTQNTNIKADGASAFPNADTEIGTFDAVVIGVECPKAQRYTAQNHFQWIIKTKAVNHGDKEINHWITFSTENAEKIKSSTAYFVSLAKQLQKATGTPETSGEMSAKDAIDAINALKGKTLKVTQTHNGKRYVQTYSAKA